LIHHLRKFVHRKFMVTKKSGVSDPERVDDAQNEILEMKK
jgi:hypothetical protein